MTAEPEHPDRPADGGIIDELTDDETPLGDTTEVHDEMSPRDLPKSHPAREETVRQAGGTRATTSGSD